MASGYEQLPGFEGVYLEDSFVLAIREDMNRLEFDLEIVLRESHPRYHPPKQGEQYYYEKTTLVFSGVSSKVWTRRSIVAVVDANGETDYGNIDRFELLPSGEYDVEGEWGQVRVRSGVPILEHAHA